MNLLQLTVIVTVNIMGSGIIMLPANMAQVGAISLLSWLVTALGSMAIAYGFAQAGLLNQRTGGMSAYAEDAYGRSGFFMVFYLYFFCLAVGNVAIAVTAVGYLAPFIPWLTSTPMATCIGAIALIWLTTVANFRGPRVTGHIGTVTVWGVIIPVAGISLIGWLFFKPDIFAAAWNPKHLSLLEGMGSSIALTLWAFLGMESAAQNSDAVENPKRDVPLACMLGTLGAGVVYILSTTVIQGIVPNAELAKSTGPFGLAYAKMFNPTVGSIVMALAAIACIGSLLGWQFTIARTAKSAAEDRMFPAWFAKVNKSNAPIIGMTVMGVVQSVMTFESISPSLSQQFSAVVNLAVVTNVIPYIISLSALIVMMQKAGVTGAEYRRNVVVSVIATLYSTYAIYACGATAVLGGTVVMVLGFVIYGFLAPRFELRKTTSQPAEAAGRLVTTGVALALLVAAAAPVRAATLDRVRESGKLRLGYLTEARPFSYQDVSGHPAGYSVALCQKVADAVKAELGAELGIEWVKVAGEDRFAAVESGKIDLLCSAAAATLDRMKRVDFSLPTFPGGIGALLRADSPAGLQAVLEGREQPYSPRWRASLQQVLGKRTLSAMAGTTADRWLTEKRGEFDVRAELVPVPSYEEGVARVLGGRSDVFFGDRAVLLATMARSEAPSELIVLERQYTYEPMALVFTRDDADLRLLVDRTLSRLYRTGEIAGIYATYFGDPDATALSFFRFMTLPE
jgi:putrescine:ornithine antiporter